MVLRPQDLGIALKLMVTPLGASTTRSLAADLGISIGEISNALRRCVTAQLVTRAPPEARQSQLRRGGQRMRLMIRQTAMREFVLHGIRYVWPPERGPIVRGVATAHAAAPLLGLIASDEAPPVWPYPAGAQRGESFSPLFDTAPAASTKDPALYEVLALVDAIRAGRARERNLASELFQAYVEKSPRA